MLDYSAGRSSPVTAKIRSKIEEIEGREFAAPLPAPRLPG